MTLINKKMKKFLILAIVCIISAVSFAQKKVTLKAGTIIPLQSVAQVKAADVNEGELIDFRVSSDIKVGEVVVIPMGTIVKGTVYEAKKSSPLGFKGSLVINLNYINLPSGDYIYLSNTAARVYGKNRTPLAVALGIFTVFGFLIPGTKAVMPEGYEVRAYIAANTEIAVN